MNLLRCLVAGAILGIAFCCQFASAAIIMLDLSTPVLSGVLSDTGSGKNLEYSLGTTAFTVNDGDTVQVKLMFDSSASFQLIPSYSPCRFKSVKNIA